MAMDTSQLPLAKPEPRKKTKARAKRQEAQVVQQVRQQVVARDGYCRVPQQMLSVFGVCDGPSEWSHYNTTHRRSKTMGQPPAERHQSAHSLMLCHYHSQEYDQNRMRITELTARGCDGPLEFRRDRVVLVEEEFE